MGNEEMERGQFTFYRSYYEALKTLSRKDRLAAYDAIISYALDGVELDLSGAAATAFILIRPVLDTGRKRSKIGKQGGKSGRADAKQTVSKTEANPKQSAREKEKEEEIEKENEIEDECHTRAQRAKPKQKFTPPTVEEVAAYAAQRGAVIDAQRFVDFYASKGWVIGKSPMKDWRAAVRTWEQRDRREERPHGMTSSTPDAGELERMRRLRERMKGEET